MVRAGRSRKPLALSEKMLSRGVFLLREFLRQRALSEVPANIWLKQSDSGAGKVACDSV